MSHAMPRYSPERKEALLRKLLPPHNVSVAELARQEGISDVTLYAWRKQSGRSAGQGKRETGSLLEW
jgi:transposase-like protein